MHDISSLSNRSKSLPPLRVGVGGPVGAPPAPPVSSAAWSMEGNSRLMGMVDVFAKSAMGRGVEATQDQEAAGLPAAAGWRTCSGSSCQSALRRMWPHLERRRSLITQRIRPITRNSEVIWR